jgi:hypothetical protein
MTNPASNPKRIALNEKDWKSAMQIAEHVFQLVNELKRSEDSMVHLKNDGWIKSNLEWKVKMPAIGKTVPIIAYISWEADEARRAYAVYDKKDGNAKVVVNLNGVKDYTPDDINELIVHEITHLVDPGYGKSQQKHESGSAEYHVSREEIEALVNEIYVMLRDFVKTNAKDVVAKAKKNGQYVDTEKLGEVLRDILLKRIQKPSKIKDTITSVGGEAKYNAIRASNWAMQKLMSKLYDAVLELTTPESVVELIEERKVTKKKLGRQA